MLRLLGPGLGFLVAGFVGLSVSYAGVSTHFDTCLLYVIGVINSSVRANGYGIWRTLGLCRTGGREDGIVNDLLWIYGV
jgi:hypothetical protein